MPDEPRRVLVTRLSAMGDIFHTMPAVATLRASWPSARITWAVAAKWACLLDGNPNIDRVVAVDRRSWAGARAAWRDLRAEPVDLAIDFQGLLQSAIVARIAGAMVAGPGAPREPAAGWLYQRKGPIAGGHIVDQHLALAESAGAKKRTISFAVPRGASEGRLPDGDFVLGSPLAGWTSKQWPAEYWADLAKRLAPLPLVLNGPPGFASIDGAWRHESGIAGLIDATRRARAVVGVDSGPLHLAAALGKPGVAIFGPTDPARNGPYGGLIGVLRDPNAVTSYRRGETIDASMRAVTPEAVERALRERMG